MTAHRLPSRDYLARLSPGDAHKILSVHQRELPVALNDDHGVIHDHRGRGYCGVCRLHQRIDGGARLALPG
jgi:hypothetical protein